MSERNPFLGEREIGKFRPSRFDIRREERERANEEERGAVRKLALIQATLTSRRDSLARKIYHGEPFTFADWPALELLTPKERTRIIADVRRTFGLRSGECSCLRRAHGIHRRDCEGKRKP